MALKLLIRACGIGYLLMVFLVLKIKSDRDNFHITAYKHGVAPSSELSHRENSNEGRNNIKTSLVPGFQWKIGNIPSVES